MLALGVLPDGACPHVGFEHGVVIKRASKALVVTYSMQRTDEVDDYLSQKLAPVVPLLVFGRVAGAEPKCTKDKALFYCWKDCLVSL